MNKLWVTSYKLFFIVRATGYLLHTSYELLFISRFRSYFYYTSKELLFIAVVTGYCLLHELRVTFGMWVTSYYLMMRYNKDKDDKAVYDNKCVGKNYSLGLGKLRFRVISIQSSQRKNLFSILRYLYKNFKYQIKSLH